MAYNRNKVILYGVAGIILALAVLSFIPTRTETHLITSISLTTIPEYGIQFIKMSEETTQITNLVLNIESVEAQTSDGAWVKIASTTQQWDIWQKTEILITIDPSITGYTRIRVNLAQDNPVTLTNGQIIPLGASSLPIEVNLNSVNAGTQLKLSLSQGTDSNYILPNLQIELTTNKVTAEITNP